MDISTVGDANTALAQLLTDLANTEQSIINAQSQGGFFTGILDQVSGADALAASSTSLITQLTNWAKDIGSQIDGLDQSTPLTAQQIASLQALQQAVIKDRLQIGNDISSVNWTFGGIWSDSVDIIENWGSQAVAPILPSGWGLPTWIGVIVAIAVIVFIWRETQ